MGRARPSIVLATLLASAAALAAEPTRLLRFPDLHGDRVVFCYAGDLWLAPAGGGSATRLTAHPGVEVFPKFSPDGAWIAFTGQYDGDEQVYVVPAAGGMPRQLTYYPARGPLPPRWGYDNQVYGWTPDGRSVLFRSMRYGFDLTDTRLYTVPIDGGLPAPLAMPVSGAGALSPDGRHVAYSPLVRDFRTWKRYSGGWAQDLYIFDLSTHDLERVTDHPRSDRDPMWVGDRIVFSSDRDGKLNLYAFDTRGRRTEQLTRSTDWDLRWPSDDGASRIVYERNGRLEILDLASGAARAIELFVPDDGLARRPRHVEVGRLIEDFSLSPQGERALFVARGDVFSAPIEKGPTRNLTRSSGAHDKWARWSPDGKRIAFLSDRDGEEEVWLVDQDASGEPEQITDGGRAMRYAPEWAPDGKRLAFGDKDGKLWVLELGSRALLEVADEPLGQIRDYVWSPHGGHLAFSMTDSNSFSSLWVWSVGEPRARRVTGEMFNEYSPSWDPGGDYLFFLSDREYAPQISSIEWNYATDRETGIFALALRKDVGHPFPPESDEVGAEDEDAGDEAGEREGEKGEKRKKGKRDGQDDDDGEEDDDGKDGKDAKPYLQIDFEGLGERVARVPVDADNYGSLVATEKHLLYTKGSPFYYGRSGDRRTSLHLFSREEREESDLAEDVRGFATSLDGSKALVRHESGFKLYDVPPKGKDSAKSVSTSGLAVDLVPAEEWAQIFEEVWRRYRDFFYVENMHGYDWEALGEQYRPLLAHVGHRSDLNYVIGEMIAELNVGHAYVSGGDFEIPDRPQVALPGAELELDASSGRYRIARVLAGHNAEERYRSPLTEIGVAAAAGEYVLAIDGVELRAGDNPYRLLRHKAGSPVELTLNDRPAADGARKVTFRPITSEADLRYLDFVTRNRERVEKLSEGRVGYLHIPDMGSDGIREFIKYFYGQIRKEGLVVDVRNNGGGNVSQMLIERLRRRLLGTRFARTNEWPTTYPLQVFHGHMACVLDEDSASDGDIFPHMFRQAGLGPLVGKRSWGGVVGITNRGTLVDGGTVNVPEFGTNAIDGSWVIEGHGVDPDIEVENDARSVLEGRDPQLERAVQEVLRRMREEPRSLPERPADPVKT